MICLADFINFRNLSYQCVEQVTNYEVASCKFLKPAYLYLRTGAYIEISGLGKYREKPNMIEWITGVNGNKGATSIPTPLLKVAGSTRKFFFDLSVPKILRFNEMDEVTQGILPEGSQQLHYSNEKIKDKLFLDSSWPYTMRLLKFSDGFVSVNSYGNQHGNALEFTAPANLDNFSTIYFAIPLNWTPIDAMVKYCQDNGFDSGYTFEKAVLIKPMINTKVYNIYSHRRSKIYPGAKKAFLFRKHGDGTINASCRFKELKIKL